MSRGAVRRAGTLLATDHAISFRPAEPRREASFTNAINIGLLTESSGAELNQFSEETRERVRANTRFLESDESNSGIIGLKDEVCGDEWFTLSVTAWRCLRGRSFRTSLPCKTIRWTSPTRVIEVTSLSIRAAV